MLWVIYICLIMVGLFCRNSKCYDFTVVVFLGFLALINTDSADYSGVYLATYLNPTAVEGMDPGWVLLCQMGASLNLSYNGFACILTVVSMLLLRYYCKAMGSNSSLMLSMFLIYPGLMSIVQFRQFVASAIGAVALAVICSKIRWRDVLFSAMAVLAFFVHRSAIILFLVLLCPVLKMFGRKGRVAAAIFLVSLGLLALLNARAIAETVFGEYRTGIYLSAFGGDTAVSSLGGVRNAALVIVMALLPFLCYRYIRRVMPVELPKETSTDVLPDLVQMMEFSRTIVVFELTLMVLLPVVLITNDFMRFERYGFTYALALFSAMPEVRSRHPLLSCKALYVALCAIFAFSYVANTFDSVYGALLSYEYLPKILG